MKTCPACAEQIPDDAATCVHCGISLHEYAPGERRKTSKSLIVGLIIAGVLGFLVICAGVVAIPMALVIPATQQAREAARRSQCKNNLKQIGLALHNYHDTYGALPPAFVADKDGKPMHSWRVLILPFLDQAALYNEIDFSEPWDGPKNSRLLARMPAVYRCPSSPTSGPETNTAYAGVFGKQCIFRGSDPVAFKEITDGTSSTLMVGEVAKSNIPWMKPEDIDVALYPAIGTAGGFGSDHAGGAHFLMADGSVHFLSTTRTPESMQALFTRDGNDQPGSF